MLLPGTGRDVIGEDAAAGWLAGAGDCVSSASAAAGSASSATTAAEARWLDRIVFIEYFLGLTLSAIWKADERLLGRCRALPTCRGLRAFMGKSTTKLCITATLALPDSALVRMRTVPS
jgi:hypothetical protein